MKEKLEKERVIGKQRNEHIEIKNGTRERIENKWEQDSGEIEL